MNNRFQNLSAYKNDTLITEAFQLKWVSPYYLKLIKDGEEWINLMKSLKTEMSEELILKLLGDTGWRSRQTGAYFAAIKNSTQLTDIIGIHLLKSEVCFAGKQYAITLAMFNTEKSIKYLTDYLDFYLHHPELEFDQIEVFEALKYIDQKHQTNYLIKHKDEWNKFCQINIERFEKIVLINHSKGSDEYKKAMERVNSVWNYNRDPAYVRKRIETITKIKGENL